MRATIRVFLVLVAVIVMTAALPLSAAPHDEPTTLSVQSGPGGSPLVPALVILVAISVAFALPASEKEDYTSYANANPPQPSRRMWLMLAALLVVLVVSVVVARQNAEPARSDTTVAVELR